MIAVGSFSEHSYEKAVINQLVMLGYEHRYGPDIPRETQDYRMNLKRLCEQLIKSFLEQPLQKLSANCLQLKTEVFMLETSASMIISNLGCQLITLMVRNRSQQSFSCLIL